MVVSLDVPP
jgi:hypothetical protein